MLFVLNRIIVVYCLDVYPSYNSRKMFFLNEAWDPSPLPYENRLGWRLGWERT